MHKRFRLVCLQLTLTVFSVKVDDKSFSLIMKYYKRKREKENKRKKYQRKEGIDRKIKGRELREKEEERRKEEIQGQNAKTIRKET